MISCAILERPGRWRTIAALGLLVLLWLPAVPLLAEFTTNSTSVWPEEAFLQRLWPSSVLALTVVALTFGVGLATGVLTALYEFPARTFLLFCALVPFVVPTFLWAIGWSALAAQLGWQLSGLGACVLVFSAALVPLPFFSAFLASRALSASQLEAVRLAGSEKAAFASALHHASKPCLLAACLAGILTLADPGPGHIFGMRSAAGAILTSFSALFDYSLAARQCLALSVAVLIWMIVPAWMGGRRIAEGLLARQTRPMRAASRSTYSIVAFFGLLILIATSVGTPGVGLVLPLRGGEGFTEALGTLRRTVESTLVYAVGAGMIAAVYGLSFAFVCGRQQTLRFAVVAVLMVLFALPPALAAIGVAGFASRSPEWADWLLRSRVTVCAVAGLRLAPVGTVLTLRAWSSSAQSWAFAAALHGVSMKRYLSSVVLPFLLPTIGGSIVLCSLLAAADITTILLLHPPGEASLSLALFTIMANAPESLVAWLCIVYVSCAVVALAAVGLCLGRNRG